MHSIKNVKKCNQYEMKMDILLVYNDGDRIIILVVITAGYLYGWKRYGLQILFVTSFFLLLNH